MKGIYHFMTMSCGVMATSSDYQIYSLLDQSGCYVIAAPDGVSPTCIRTVCFYLVEQVFMS